MPIMQWFGDANFDVNYYYVKTDVSGAAQRHPLLACHLGELVLSETHRDKLLTE